MSNMSESMKRTFECVLLDARYVVAAIVHCPRDVGSAVSHVEVADEAAGLAVGVCADPAGRGGGGESALRILLVAA